MNKMIEALSVEMAFGDYATAAKLMLVLPAHDAEIRLEAQRDLLKSICQDWCDRCYRANTGMSWEVETEHSATCIRVHASWDKAHPEPEGKRRSVLVEAQKGA